MSSLEPSFCVLLTIVVSVGVESVLATFTTLLSFHAQTLMLPDWRNTDSPRENFFASSLISEGKFFLLVRIVPQPYVPSVRSLSSKLIVKEQLVMIPLHGL